MTGGSLHHRGQVCQPDEGPLICPACWGQDATLAT